MSESQNDSQQIEDTETVIESGQPIKREKRSNWPAWLAVLLAGAALVLVATVLFQDWRRDNSASQDSGIEQRIKQTEDALAALQLRFSQMTYPDYGSDIGALRKDMDERIQALDTLPSRMSTIENSVASMAGLSSGSKELFLLAEAEYYLLIANAQLQLANNPQVASLALNMADERVAQVSDPALTTVRRAIADELAALQVMGKPDLEGATLTLASLARVIESLPLAVRTIENEPAGTAEERGGVDRAWDSVKSAMSGLVKITPPDQAKLALISPHAEAFLRNNIALQLQTARLALLRSEQAIFEHTLDDTSALLGAYFDSGNEQVSSTQLTITEVRESVFVVSVPDISESLRLLRQFRALRENSE